MKKIESADGVILASPNYVANVSGLMKNFIDRFAYTMHRPKYFNQKFMLVIASGSYMGVKSAMKSLSVIVSGGKIISNLAVFNSPEINEKKQKSQELKIKKSAKKFAKMLSKKTLTKPSISFLIWFSVFKASSVINKKGLPADYEYYKDKKYFTECELNSFQKATIKVFTQFFGFLLQKGLI